MRNGQQHFGMAVPYPGGFNKILKIESLQKNNLERYRESLVFILECFDTGKALRVVGRKPS